MPPPYPLLEMPPGEFSNMFDYPAIHMTAAHNMFIQGINAIVAHAPYVQGDKIQPFLLFAITNLDVIHHHHRVEETYYFDALEKKLGKGYLETTKEQHDTFVPQIEICEKWLRDVRDGKEPYDGKKLLSLINDFADNMFDHLNHEPTKLDREKMREHFTEKELKEIDDQFMKVAFQNIDFHTALPISAVCANPKTPWFPPFPTPLRWAIRFWFSRKHREAWEFGAMDFKGNLRELPPPPRE